MKLRPQTWIVLSGGLALLIGTGSFAFRESQQAASANRRLATSETERIALRREIEKLEHRLPQPHSVSSSTISEKPADLPATVNATPPPITPEIIAALRLDSARADARSGYAPFFSQRGFSREKIAAFAEQMAQHIEKMETLANELPVTIPNDPNHPLFAAFKARQQKEETRFATELESFLGPDDFTRLRQFQSEMRFWVPVQSLAGRLHTTETPLTPDQASQLADVLVAQATDASGKFGPAVTDWDRVFARATGFLSPPQLDVLKTQHEYDETWRKLNRLSGQMLRAARAAASKKGP